MTSEKTVSIKEGTSDVLTMTSIVTGPASDIDGDGIIDSLDNCPNVSNANQRDFDSNGEGDACEDSDGDGILDKQDICPLIPNPGQEDLNFNGIGDACDSDGDGVIVFMIIVLKFRMLTSLQMVMELAMFVITIKMEMV